MSATVAAGLLATLASNAMADAKVQTANENERQNMFLQNMINRRNNVLAYSDQVQGAKMAGLSPAMLNGATPSVAAPVTKANSHVAENVEIDPATLLLRAQKDNLDAQTEKTRAETEKIEGVDTENTVADTLLKNASADEKKALTERTNQINTQWTDQNKALSDQGQAMAQKWQSEKWYNALAPDTKATIDAIADGSIPLTVGSMDALGRVIHAQSDLSDADAKLVKNAFANAVLASQFSDKAVFDAIVNDPKVKQSLTQEQTEKLKADVERIRYRMKDVIDSEIDKMDSERNVNNADYWLKLKQKLAMEYENMDLSRGEGRYGNYAWRVMENTVSAIVDIVKSLAAAFLGGKIVGSSIKSGVESATQSKSHSSAQQNTATHNQANEHWSTPPIYGPHGEKVKPGYEYWTDVRERHDYESGESGVQQMKFK